MRLLTLQLRAYGPFTDRTLDLSAGADGLHIVFGPNEAGKSSALRALRALLFGIKERTPDTFLHDNAKLRIGGHFRDRAGNELVCYRRKGRKNTLLDADDKPIPDERLTRLLHGVDERLFERLFGIDHETLVSGGQALLAEHGREAETLFGTGLGSTRVRAVLESLDQEAAALFAPRATKPLVNATLGQLAETQRRLREVSLSARHWEAARYDLEQVRAQLAALDERLIAATRRRGTLERLRRTMSGLAKRRQLRDRLAELGELPVLAEGFADRRDAAATQRRLAVEGRIKAAARLVELREQAGALVVSEDLLAQAEAIDDLREQLGGHRKAAQDRPALVIREAAQRDQARQRLAAIRPGLALTDSERLRPLLGRRRRAAELGGRQEALAAAVRTTRAALAETTQALALRREALHALALTPPLDGLRQAVTAARRAGDLDREATEAMLRRQRHTDACTRELAALGLWTGGLAALRVAPLPGDETVRRFSVDFQSLEEEERRLDQANAESESERRRTRETERALQLAGSVPTEEDLRAARAHRDQGWQLLKRHWLDGANVDAETQQYGQGASLPVAFEGAMTATDELADRLRREAQRVHEQAAVRARLESCEQTLITHAATGVRLTERRLGLERGWHQVWADCGVPPRTPREMADWLVKVALLRDKAGAGDELAQRLVDLRGQREGLHRGLVGALAAVGESWEEAGPAAGAGPALAPLLDHAEARLRALEAEQRHRTTLLDGIVELESRRTRLELEAATAEAALADWQSAWAALMTELGLAPNATPGEVSDDLQAIADILTLLDEAAGLASRIGAMDADAGQFTQRAGGLLERLAPDLLGRPVEEAVPLLHQRLVTQRETRSRLKELLTQASLAAQEVQEADAAIQAADTVLGALCRQAGCNQPDQLPAIEGLVREQRDCAEQLRRLETELIEGGDGLGLADLEVEAQAADLDAVMAELAAVNARIAQELQPERETLLALRINAERDFAAMAGSDAAAALAEEAEHTIASLRAQAERYCRVRLAGRVLREEIERFRRRHRDPILSLAGGHFAQLTCRSFAAVETDFDESDQPVLVGVRPTGERLRVEAMSTGTRDQLYLALRLATLEHSLEDTEPLPFIVDDILIQFDDARAHATLGALADFSSRTQVILFTHHTRVVEQARTLDHAAERVFIHEL
jgi:uncharacterized protein YhaN